MKAIEWLERLQAARGGLSDYQTAKILGVQKQAISKMRTGQVKTLADETCYRIANELGVDPMEVIADQGAERAKSEELRNFWEKVARSVAVVMLSAGIATYPADTQAFSKSQASAHSIYYAQFGPWHCRSDLLIAIWRSLLQGLIHPIPGPQDAPSPLMTDGISRIRIFRSSHSDHSSMYFRSSCSHFSNDSRLRPDTSRRHASPGRTLNRRR